MYENLKRDLLFQGPVQHNDNLKAYRYVAGLSREAMLQADEEGDT